MATESETVVAALRSFFVEMREWELACTARRRQTKAGQLKAEDANRINLTELIDLFRRRCTTWEQPGRGGSYAVGAEYDPQGEKVLDVEVAVDIATVRTEQTTARPNRRYVYTLKRSSDGWRLVDDRQWLDREGVAQPGFL